MKIQIFVCNIPATNHDQGFTRWQQEEGVNDRSKRSNGTGCSSQVRTDDDHTLIKFLDYRLSCECSYERGPFCSSQWNKIAEGKWPLCLFVPYFDDDRLLYTRWDIFHRQETTPALVATIMKQCRFGALNSNIQLFTDQSPIE